MRRFEGHTDWVTSVCFSPDGQHALSGSYDKTIRLWDVKSGREVRKSPVLVRYMRYTGDICSFSFSSDGRYAFSMTKNSMIETFWDESAFSYTAELGEIESGRWIGRFSEHNDWVNSVCLSPDGRYALSGSDDKTIRLWEVDSGKEVKRFEGHTGYVFSVIFSPDGRYALSGSRDKTIRLWEVDSGKEIRRFEGHTGYVTSVCFSPDGRYALSGSDDKTIRLWEVYYPKKDWGRMHPYPLLCRVKAVGEEAATHASLPPTEKMLPVVRRPVEQKEGVSRLAPLYPLGKV